MTGVLGGGDGWCCVRCRCLEICAGEWVVGCGDALSRAHPACHDTNA